MAMFTLYGDASGTDPSQAIFALGGFLATVEQWGLFSQRWEQMLAKESVPAYHATDLEKGYRDFKGWTEKRKLRFQTSAYKTIGEYAAVGIASAIIKNDFEDQKIRWRKIPHGKPANYYIFCVHDFVRQVNKWSRRYGYNEPINYIFEQGDKGKGEVDRIFLELSSDPNFDESSLIGSVRFVCKKQRLRPLEAADIWAYESYRQTRDRILPVSRGRDTRQPERPFYRQLFKPNWFQYNVYWDKDGLTDFAEKARAIEAL